MSHFRNSAGYLSRYIDQMERLQKSLLERHFSLSLVLGYGDSSDKTAELLYEECVHHFDATLVEVSHGGPNYGSVVHPQRFRQLAFIGNKLFSYLPELSDCVGLVESDLIWKPEVLLGLILTWRELQEKLHQQVMIAPLVLHLDERFYDVWAFRKTGLNFTHQPPYHQGLQMNGRWCNMDSVGSLFFLDTGMARSIRWPEQDVVVGFCRQFKQYGGKIFVDKQAKVYHP